MGYDTIEGVWHNLLFELSLVLQSALAEGLSTQSNSGMIPVRRGGKAAGKRRGIVTGQKTAALDSYGQL